MSKAKDTIEEIRKKVFERKKEEAVQKAEEVIEQTYDSVVFDVIQDPSTTSHKFLIVKIKYDLATKKAVVMEVRPFQDKAVGLSMQIDKDNRKQLFEKNRERKNENK